MWVTGTFDFTADALIKYRVCITCHVSVYYPVRFEIEL